MRSRMYTFLDFSNTGIRSFLWYNHKPRFSWKYTQSDLGDCSYLPSTSAEHIWHFCIRKMKLEDNSINTSQAAVTGTRWLGLVVIPRCQLQASRAVPRLQAPGGPAPVDKLLGCQPAAGPHYTHWFEPRPALEPARSVILGNAASPKSGGLILQILRRSKPFMN